MTSNADADSDAFIACPDVETLKLMLSGGESSADLEQHIETCDACQQTLDNLTTSAQGGNPPSPQLSSSHLPAYLRDIASELSDSAGGPEEIPNVSIPGFEIKECLGHGGMGVVYRARHQQLDREVAVKVIAAGVHSSEEYRRRLQREGQLVARLDHPHIVRIFDSGHHEDQPYLVLEFMDGGSLSHFKSELQDPRECARLMELLARALHVAHDAGIVHRDLKPANILLATASSPSEESVEISGNNFIPKIADFGLSKELVQQDSITHSTGVFGTPGYMAPEQANEQRDQIGPATDIHALGVMLYELLTGRRPFDATTALRTIENVRNARPSPIQALRSDVPEPLEWICLQCLQKQPQARYSSTLELADELERFQRGESLLHTDRNVTSARNLGIGKWIAGLIAASLVGLFSVVYLNPGFESTTNIAKTIPQNVAELQGQGTSERGDDEYYGTVSYADDPHRWVAMWVMREGGVIKLEKPKEPFYWSPEELPTEPFLVRVVQILDSIEHPDHLVRPAKLPSIRVLNLANIRQANFPWEFIDQFQNLTWLSMVGSNFDDNDLANLNGLQNIRRLNLGRTRITAKSLPRIWALPVLNYLQIDDSILLGIGADTVLARIPRSSLWK